MKKIAVLISNKGTGTNLQAIIDAVENGKINAEIAVVISDKEEAIGLDRARKHNLQIEICPQKELLLGLLKKYKIDFICLAGWMQIVTDDVIDEYKDKILNVHPGLIPDSIDGIVKNPDNTDGLWNKGKATEKAMQNFFDEKATYAGSSVHFLTHEFDFGPVLGRVFEEIKPNDTIDSLYARLKVKENQAYVNALEKLCKE